MITHKIEKITCKNAFACSKKLVEKYERETNLKLYARYLGDIPDGSVSILHIPNKHQVTLIT